jgi:hypothetical protein
MGGCACRVCYARQIRLWLSWGSSGDLVKEIVLLCQRKCTSQLEKMILITPLRTTIKQTNKQNHILRLWLHAGGLFWAENTQAATHHNQDFCRQFARQESTLFAQVVVFYLYKWLFKTFGSSCILTGFIHPPNKQTNKH